MTHCLTKYTDLSSSDHSLHVHIQLKNLFMSLTNHCRCVYSYIIMALYVIFIKLFALENKIQVRVLRFLELFVFVFNKVEYHVNNCSLHQCNLPK